jgi:predicted dehydrogenase
LAAARLGSLEVINFTAPHLGSKFMVTSGDCKRSEPAAGPFVFAAQLEHAVRAMWSDCTPLTGGSDAISNMEVIDAIYQAARENGRTWLQ